MIEVDDLNRTGKMDLGQIPDPLGPGVALILDIDLKLRVQPSVAGEVLIL